MQIALKDAAALRDKKLNDTLCYLLKLGIKFISKIR